MIITCPKCFTADEVSYVKAPEPGFLYLCSRKHDGAGPWEWFADPKDPTAASEGWGGGGVTADLLHPIEQIVRSLPHVWLEHGVIEYELRTRYPDLFAAHVAERGHVLTGATRGTASATRFAAALVGLERAGIVRSHLGPATGAWSYNSKVGHWILEPAPPAAVTLTWAQRAHDLGRDEQWTDIDRQSVAAMTTRRST